MAQTTAASGGASQAQEKAQQAADQAREKAQEGAQRAREGLRGQIDQRSTQAGRQVSGQSEDIRTVAQQLREQGKEGPAKLAEQAADRAQRLGSWLEDSDAEQILDEVEGFARRSPWAVALGGLALGFAASRMLRASSSDRYQGRASGDGAHGELPARLPAGGTTGPAGRGAGYNAPAAPIPPAGAGYEPPVATTPPATGGAGTERL